MSKKIFHGLHTQNFPCGEYGRLTCLSRLLAKKAQFLGCNADLLGLDDYVEEFRDENLKVCGPNETLYLIHTSYANMEKWFEKQCILKTPCVFTKYYKTVEKRGSKTPQIHIKLEASVDHLKSELNYDLQSLICEVGGALGLTLGLSGLSLIQNIFRILN